MILQSERLHLRPLHVDDAEPIHELFSDPVAMRPSLTDLRDRAQTQEWLELALRRAQATGVGFRAVTLRTDGSYLGHAGLLPQEVDGVEELEVAYWFLRKHWGRGYATEAACALRDHALFALKRRRLVSLIAQGNSASQAVAQRIGMLRERSTRWKGLDVDVYALER